MRGEGSACVKDECVSSEGEGGAHVSKSVRLGNACVRGECMQMCYIKRHHDTPHITGHYETLSDNIEHGEVGVWLG